MAVDGERPLVAVIARDRYFNIPKFFRGEHVVGGACGAARGLGQSPGNA